MREQYKSTNKDKKDKEDAEKRVKNLEEAKEIIIEEDKSLPIAKCIKILDCKKFEGSRVKIHGWVHRLRKQSNK